MLFNSLLDVESRVCDCRLLLNPHSQILSVFPATFYKSVVSGHDIVEHRSRTGKGRTNRMFLLIVGTLFLSDIGRGVNTRISPHHS